MRFPGHALRAGAALLALAATAGTGARAAQAAPAWLPPTTLSAAGQDGDQGTVAIDPSGNSTAVWVRLVGDAYRVQTSDRPAGGAWSPATELSADGGSAFDPQISFDQRGNATAIWRRTDGANKIVQAVTRLAGGGWSAPENLSAAGNDAASPLLITDALGRATAIWSRFDGVRDVLQTASRGAVAGGGAPAWGPSIDLSDAARDATSADVAADARGALVAVWSRTDGTHDRVQSRTRGVDGTWAPVATLSSQDEDATQPQVAAAAGGIATAVWRETDTLSNVIKASSKPVDAAWSDPANVLPSSETSTNASPQIGVDAAGNATAIWLHTDGTGTAVDASSRIGTGGWDSPLALSASTQNSAAPDLVVDAKGTAVAAWQQSDGENPLIRAAVRLPGAPWTAPATLSAAGGDATAARLDLGTQGDVVASWQRLDRLNLRAQVAVLDLAGPAIAPVAAQSLAPNVAAAFTTAATDAWSGISGIRWNFGDGTSADGAAVSHAWAAPGAYRATITATDTLDNASSFAFNEPIVAVPSTVTPLPPTVTPKRIAALLLAKRISVDADLKLKKKSGKCPKASQLTVSVRTSAKGKPKVSLGKRRVKVTKGAGICRVTGTVDLKKKPTKSTKLTIRLGGKGLSSSSIKVTRG